LSLDKIGIAAGLTMEIFAITADRRIRHPGVVAMTASAKKDLPYIQLHC